MVPFPYAGIMVPLYERRHRIQGQEVQPVVGAMRDRLMRLVAAREDFDEACLLFRVLYRLDSHSPGRPDYPELEWAAKEAYLNECRGGLQYTNASEKS